MASRIDSLPFFLIYFSFLIETIAQSPFDFTECNGVKICLLSPSNCLQNTDTCTNGVSIKQTGAKTIEIELFANNLPYMGWMAMGFQGVACKNIEGTGGPCMANTPVTECSWTNGRQMTAGLSYNDATPQNLRITNVDALMKAINFTQEVVTQVENMTYCRVSQMVTAAPLNGVFDADKRARSSLFPRYSALNMPFDFNECLTKKHCVFGPANCEKDKSCIHGASIRLLEKKESEVIEVEMWSSDLPEWMGVGVQSKECDEVEGNGGPCFANTPTVDCSVTGKGSKIGLSYMDSFARNTRINNLKELMNLTELRSLRFTKNRITYCKVEMLNGMSMKGVGNGHKVLQIDPTKSYLLLTAQGPSNGTTFTSSLISTIRAGFGKGTSRGTQAPILRTKKGFDTTIESTKKVAPFISYTKSMRRFITKRTTPSPIGPMVRIESHVIDELKLTPPPKKDSSSSHTFTFLVSAISIILVILWCL
ncbi:unnamed protein product, partial [Mesorhabditis belari]|uniref:Uncharacterized protein n=1 Tax=Mesorhabditis belari TaxID=2138241 RepID=A0AAF3EQ73_9BILA